MYLIRSTIIQKHFQRGAANRQGAVIVLVAVLLIAILACTSLCIDIGWASLSKSELQNAADSSSAAGAAQLMTNYGAYMSPSQSNPNGLISSAEASATTYCVQYAGYNKSGDVSSLKLLSSDIQFGFTDATGNFQSNSSSYPNTVQVLLRRDSTANTPLPLFFASIFGTSSLNLSATSSATTYAGIISSFNPNGGGSGASFAPTPAGTAPSGAYGSWGNSYSSSTNNFNCKLLPLAFDVNEWNMFFSTGMSPDGTINTDANNNPQIQVYPSPKNSPGNFGLLCIGPWTNATPDYEYWVLNGPRASDLQSLVNAGSFPVSMSTPKPWKGSPGLRSVLSSYFSQIIGQPRLLPLFQPATVSPYQAASGSGSNTTYAIVGFVGVKVNHVSGSGSNLNISVQPCPVIDPTAVFDSTTVYPVGAAPASQLQSFTYLPPMITK